MAGVMFPTEARISVNNYALLFSGVSVWTGICSGLVRVAVLASRLVETSRTRMKGSGTSAAAGRKRGVLVVPKSLSRWCCWWARA